MWDTPSIGWPIRMDHLMNGWLRQYGKPDISGQRRLCRAYINIKAGSFISHDTVQDKEVANLY